MRTEWVEGISGGQGLQILARLGKSRVDDLAVSAGEGGNVIAAFTRLLDEGAEVTLRTYDRVGKEISTIRRELNKAGEVIREGVIR